MSLAGPPLGGEGMVVLASASRTRRRILAQAGLSFACDAAGLDEAAMRTAARKQGQGVEDIARALAEAKAMEVACRHPGKLVIGADQILESGTTWVEKAPDRSAARMTLRLLRGQRHRLISAIAVVRDGCCLWGTVEEAWMTMRNFTDACLDAYMDAAGDDVLDSVGAYRVEGPGIQLFSRIDGDFYTILGLPLLPVLGFLRHEGVIPE
jgi:septum formation protein